MILTLSDSQLSLIIGFCICVFCLILSLITIIVNIIIDNVPLRQKKDKKYHYPTKNNDIYLQNNNINYSEKKNLEDVILCYLLYSGKININLKELSFNRIYIEKYYYKDGIKHCTLLYTDMICDSIYSDLNEVIKYYGNIEIDKLNFSIDILYPKLLKISFPSNIIYEKEKKIIDSINNTIN